MPRPGNMEGCPNPLRTRSRLPAGCGQFQPRRGLACRARTRTRAHGLSRPGGCVPRRTPRPCHSHSRRRRRRTWSRRRAHKARDRGGSCFPQSPANQHHEQDIQQYQRHAAGCLGILSSRPVRQKQAGRRAWVWRLARAAKVALHPPAGVSPQIHAGFVVGATATPANRPHHRNHHALSLIHI